MSKMTLFPHTNKLSGQRSISNTSTFLEVVKFLFILLFLYTALSKSFNIVTTVEALQRTNVFKGLEHLIAWTVVILEYIAVGLLLVPSMARTGLYVSTVLMTIFTAYIIFMMLYLSDLPCSCGGILSQISWKQHLILNSFFVLIGSAALALTRRYRRDKKI